MKKFVEADIVTLEVSATAFGPHDPNSVDESKYAVTDDNGNVVGWEECYGEKLS